MKPASLFVIFLLFYIAASAQKKDFSIHLKNGRRSVESNISAVAINKINQKASRFKTAYILIQFATLPTEKDKEELARQGISLLEYIPHNTYAAIIKGNLNSGILKKFNARAIIEPSPQDKMYTSLAKESLKPNAKGSKDVWISFPKTFQAAEVISRLQAMDYEVADTQLAKYRVLSIKVPFVRLAQLADLPFVEYVQPAPPKDEPLNFTHRSLSKANVLNASVSDGGRGLNGEGIVIGVGDNANVNSHVDLSNRIIDHTTSGVGEPHGIHVTGTLSGAGIIDETKRGYAPKATVISQTFSDIFLNAPTYVQQYGMIATNNSYGNALGCDYTGTYDLYARILDQMAIDYPDLQNVFAAGNSGGLNCSPAPAGFKTILGGYQAAKNIIVVGNMDANENISSISSKGPVKDGRIKPEITALGTGVWSTFPNNNYAKSNGTSMAAPGVTGGVALLYQRYKQLHGNVNPKSGLIKALLCNGAADKGNNGPDFSYGFGSMDLLRSVDMLEKNRYIIESITHQEKKQYAINIPAGTARLKVMLYWNDPAASVLSAKTLVNDLDLEIINPLSQTTFPEILDTSSTRITALATTGADHINNIEQVSIDNPQAGNYTITVNGTEIAENPQQEFFVVYDIIPNSVSVTYPAGGEGLVPGETANICWESFGDANSTFSLEYSINNGAAWTTIATGLNSGSRFYNWVVPATVTDKALIRVAKETIGQTNISQSFSIIGVPALSLSGVQCEGYFNFNWTQVSDATDYEVMMLKGDEMLPVATTANTSYTIKGLSVDSTYWVSVRARINGKAGRRAIAVSRKPNTGSCTGTISDNDLKLQAILSPVSGRKFTSSELTNTTPVKIEIKNLNDSTVNGFTVKYSVNGGATWLSEHITSGIEAGQVYTHTFSTTADLSTTGSYKVIAVVIADNNDPDNQNDTLRKTVKHLDNQPIDLTTSFVDNLEAALPDTYVSNTMGLNGLDRYDFSASTTNGRLRTFLNSGFASSGTKAFNLDAYRLTTSGNVDSLIGTYNLSNYNANNEDLRLSFRYFDHGQENYANNKVWVRKNETFPWIEVYNFNNNTDTFSLQFAQSGSIELSDSLLKYGQNVSSSFQIKWGQEGQSAIINETGNDGYSIDDISIYSAIDDIQMQTISNPPTVQCGPNAVTPLTVTINNASNRIISNIPVKYSVNGNWVSEVIPSIAGKTSLSYTFTNTMNLSTPGLYNITVVSEVPTDNYRLNDTITATIRVQPLIAAFPYLENFEQGDGWWYSEGTNNSWQYGTPASPKINKAASGLKAWKTNLSGTHNDKELSYLYSPCFAVSGMLKPTLSFSLAFDIENCDPVLCDAAWVEYSTDGQIWTRLQSTDAFNWYQNGSYWTGSYIHWHVATASLPDGNNTIRLRFVFSSDPGLSKEGIAIDDIHIYDNAKGIYDGATLSSPITKSSVNGNSWIDVESGGKLIASIMPDHQDLGAMDVQVFINTGAVRFINNQYYLDRNVTVKPSNTSLQDSILLRLYFLDSESEAMIHATGCSGCSNITNAYELGVSKYDDNSDPAIENGTVDDNVSGFWQFIQSDKVAKVPFDKGYYAEFKIKDFSEFWFSADGIGINAALPVEIVEFTVNKEGQANALISWIAENEFNIDHYEIEMANGGNFEKIGIVQSAGNTAQRHQYSFTDKDFPKSGIREYRLKIVEKDGSFTYSEIRSLTFPENRDWVLYPNPSKDGKFNCKYILSSSDIAEVQLTDVVGRIVKIYKVYGSGHVDTHMIDISGSNYARGIYILKVVCRGKEQVFKLYKQ